MNITALFTLITFLLFSTVSFAQTEDSNTEIAQITATLMDYIEGTANGEPESLRRAFHPDFNLYTVTNDTLWIRSGEAYINK